MKDSLSSAKIDQKVLELQAAMEILAEVFGTEVLEIYEIINQRYKEGLERPQRSHSRKIRKQTLLKHRYNELGEWPMEFCMAE